ncbi:MAG: hypothetical protein ACTHK4_00395 [Mycobacteriales bacterium]
MSTFTTQPYQVQDANDFLNYMQRMMGEIARLQREGRVPDDTGTNSLLSFWRTLIAQVRTDVARAGSTSKKEITSSIPMTEAEYKRNWSMYDTLLQLLQILDMRDAVDLEASEGVMRVIGAMYKGTVA